VRACLLALILAIGRRNEMHENNETKYLKDTRAEEEGQSANYGNIVVPEFLFHANLFNLITYDTD